MKKLEADRGFFLGMDMVRLDMSPVAAAAEVAALPRAAQGVIN